MPHTKLLSPSPIHHILLTTHRSFTNLSPRTRLLLGLGTLAWGTIGLYASDVAEKKFGFEPSEKDRAELKKVVPRITVVEKD
jgi:hypothetical protein